LDPPSLLLNEYREIKSWAARLGIRLHVVLRWWSYTSAPPYIFFCLLIKLGENFTLNFICHICLEAAYSPIASQIV
jgi:hypothetical protein